MSRAWYLVCLVPIAIGVTLAARTIIAMIDDVEAMQRVVMPGERELTLEAGDYLAYAESSSRVDGTEYRTRFSGACSLVDAAGAPVTLEPSLGKTRYAVGGYEGRAIYDFTIAQRGVYRFACESKAPPAVIAIGPSIRTSIVVALAAGFIGLIVAFVIFGAIRYRRKRRE